MEMLEERMTCFANLSNETMRRHIGTGRRCGRGGGFQLSTDGMDTLTKIDFRFLSQSFSFSF